MRPAVSCIGLILYLCLGEVRPDYDDDSLQAAINAVSQRRRTMSQSHEYDPDDYAPQGDALAYLDFPTGDVRLEGPGYNYQMLMSQIRGSNPYSKDDFESQNDKSRSLEEALAEYINNVSPDDVTEMKRSAFREFAEQPDLQRLGARGSGDESGFLTSFRERAKPNYDDESRHKVTSHSRNEEAAEREYLEEYFDALNDAVNTYLQNSIPLDLQKNYKDNVKRQYDNYDTSYDFFNSPLPTWKRDKSHAKSYAYGLNFYDDESSHPKRLHQERAPKTSGGLGHHVMKKRVWRDGSLDKSSLRNKATKRMMLKRSSRNSHSFSPNARLIRSKKDSHKMSMLHEKTDPNVAKELSGIFTSTKENNQTKNKTEKAVELKVKLESTTTKAPPSVKASPKPTQKPTDETKVKSKNKQKLGQLEEAIGNEPAKPIVMSKKSVDWSTYFGIDRRRKKSSNNNIDDSWLLDQYLQAYARENLGKFGPEIQEDDLEKQENYELLMESLREAADAIINKAIKYTGAHEGIKNEQVIDKVREQVMNQLALAYDLENIRRILEEHKAEYSQEPSNFYKGFSSAKIKRITVKKEKAVDPEHESTVADENNNLKTKFPKLTENVGEAEGACADVSSRITLCRTVISSNHSALITPCVIHSFCSTCSKCSECKDAPTERHCDVNFLDLSDNMCGEARPMCRYSARHVLPSMKAAYATITREPNPTSCDVDTVAKNLMQCTQNGVLLK